MADPATSDNIPTTCAECDAPLDNVSADMVRRHPSDYPMGILGACCVGHGSDDDGWGDAPRYVDGPEDDYYSQTGYGYA